MAAERTRGRRRRTRRQGEPWLAPWRAGYRAAWLGRDLVAGLTLAAFAIPVSLAYSDLAGLPPVTGLYGYLFGGLAYAALATSRHVAIGPTSSIAILLGSSLGGLAAGDAGAVLALAAITAVLVAAIGAVAWAVRFGYLASFISDTVLTGFKAGAAIVIAGTQLPKLLGIEMPPEGLPALLVDLAERIRQTNPYAVAVGAAALLLLWIGQRLLPARPVALGVVVLSIVASATLGFGARGVDLVGDLPAGLPGLDVPTFGVRRLRELLPLALGCFLLAFMETISAARALAESHRGKVDANRELLALGAANLAVAVVQAYPVAGGMSQSAVNERAGARSPLSLVFAALAIAGVLQVTHLVRDLPMPILAAVVLISVKDMVDVRALRHLRRVNKVEFRVAVVSLLGVLVLGILEGLLLAAIFSLAMMLRWAANPHMAVLGRIPGTDRFGDLERHPENETFAGVLIVRIEGGLFYFNVDSVKDRLLATVDERKEPLELLLLDLSSSPQIDLAGVRMLGEVHDRLRDRGIDLELAEVHAAVRELLRAEGMERRFGKIDRTTTCASVLEERCEPARAGAR
ncbi:MAG: SulP family inorganic anion transporter [Thermodesulfobacteriota bacterium]